MNYAEEETEKRMAEIENRLSEIYADAYKETKKATRVYFQDLQRRHDEMETKVQAGLITQDQFDLWWKVQEARGAGWEQKRDELAQIMTQTNERAAAYINDQTPGIYSLNHNFTAYQINQGMPGAEGVTFNIYDENTVRRLVEGENHVQFKTVRINPVRDYEWNKAEIDKALASGIIQGKSSEELADSFIGVMKRNRTAAVRNARTAVGSAQNGGTQECYNRAAEMGIKMQKEWIATHDERTRDSHADLDGSRVAYNERFANGLMYPCDPDGAPAEVYNCRCTTRSVLKGINDAPRMTYKEWMEREQNAIVSGAKITYKTETLDDWEKRRSKEASDFYDLVRKTDDIKTIAKNTKQSAKTIEEIKNHIFFNTHKMRDGKIKRFAPDYDMAVAWKRMQEGTQNDEDLLLLKHERLEINLVKRYNITVGDAHDKANKTYNWQDTIYEKLGPKGEADGLLR